MKFKFLICVLSCCILSPLTHALVPLDANKASLSAVKPDTQINLNAADAKVLAKSMKGIGNKRAEAIIKYRETHHGFKSVNELSEVPGLGKTFVSKNLDKLNQIFTLK